MNAAPCREQERSLHATSYIQSGRNSYRKDGFFSALGLGFVKETDRHESLMSNPVRRDVVPVAIRKRGGRKLILTPDGTSGAPAPRVRPDNALLKALARGFRWQKMLREGDYQTLEEIADVENINPSYVSRLLRMTLLSPEIVEAILAGRQRSMVRPSMSRSRLPQFRLPQHLSRHSGVS